MNPLETTGYELILQNNGIDYNFITDDGVRYNAVFGSADEFFPNTSFARQVVLFAIKPVKGDIPTPGIDPKIAHTLAKIITNKFANDSSLVLLYICATEDKKELARLRKFDKIFEENNRDKKYIKTTFSDKSTSSHGAVICASTNPVNVEISHAAANIPALF